MIFSANGAKRIAAMVRDYEREAYTLSGRRRQNVSPLPRLVLRGKLDGALSQGSSATMSVWHYDGSAETDTGENVTVYDWMLKSGQSVNSGKKVVATLFMDSGRYYVTAAECN
jgi:hypothetical protein